MPQACKACVHPQRPEIDAAIANGESLRVIAGRFGLSYSCIQRHVAHIRGVVARAEGKRERRNLKTGKTILERFDDLVDQAAKGLKNAKTDRDKIGYHAVLARYFDLAFKLGIEARRQKERDEAKDISPELQELIDGVVE